MRGGDEVQVGLGLRVQLPCRVVQHGYGGRELALLGEELSIPEVEARTVVRLGRFGKLACEAEQLPAGFSILDGAEHEREVVECGDVTDMPPGASLDQLLPLG